MLAGVLVFLFVALVVFVRGWMLESMGVLQPYMAVAMENAGSSALWALWLGLLFGLISCPVCGVPLAAYIAGGEENVRAAFYSSVLFTAGRFITFIVLGIVTGLAGSVISYTIAPVAILVAGVFMVALSADLLGLLDIRHYITSQVFKYLKLPVFSVNHPVEYMVWGTVTGFVCTVEASVFLAPISAVALANAASAPSLLFSLGKAVLIITSFAVGAFIPPTLMIMLARGSVEVAQRYMRSNVLTFVRYVGGVVLLLLGVQYIAMGLTSAQTLF
ncbi:MAG: hypothetical protein GF414_03540 [Candidatus Altiarchaeales archaeon]|nr:hypothetical protein [Candidatus Altiarchaeales archaeon]